MNVTIHKSCLQGTVQIPSSKSFVHRQLICAALADKTTKILLNQSSKDIEATIHCVEQLGATVTKETDGLVVEPMQALPEQSDFFCNESGSTLRFMLPIAAVLGINARFSGAGRLPERPNKPLLDAMRLHGVQADKDFLPLHLQGKLHGGTYKIAGNISSQYITGLLMALPLCPEDSAIVFTTPVESVAYLDITCHVLQQFGIMVSKTDDGYFIPGKQMYHSPGEIHAEGDWSSAVFWYCANHMGAQIEIEGLNPESCQGDRAVTEQLLHFGGEMNISQTPDSLPALAVAACMYSGITRFTGGKRLRIKESDRLSAVVAMLKNLGQTVEEEAEGITVYGGNPFSGGFVDGYNDHRIVMAAAIAGCLASEPVTISGAEAVSKSYPGFFNDLIAMGGKMDG